MKRVSRASEKTWLPLLCMGGGTIGSRVARERVMKYTASWWTGP